MPEQSKKSKRFPLALPPDVDETVRSIAAGDGTTPGSSINDTIVFLLREAIRARASVKSSEKKPGQSALVSATA